MNVTLVIMAAGLGSRYGGCKQTDGVGPSGEFLMEYAIHDAVKAGFNKVVFIIKPDMEDLIRRMCAGQLEKTILADGTALQVCFAIQDFSSLPDFYEIPPERTKPFGTVHAVLCAEDLIHEPFCVINADDYYGAEAYGVMLEELQRMPHQGHAAMVAYRLKNTVSIHGAVSRGVCKIEDHALASVHETKRIQLYEEGMVKDLDTDTLLDPDSPVSMNFWGFSPSVFALMKQYFEEFLRSEAGKAPTGECLLPVMVDALTKEKKLTVSVLDSPAKWFGITYRQDRESVAGELKALHEAGIYPPSLRR